MDQTKFELFQEHCQQCVEAAPSCARWQLSYREQDFGREWFVTARAGTLDATVQTFSATTSLTSVPDIIAELGKMLEELRTGQVEASTMRKVILDELLAAGLR